MAFCNEAADLFAADRVSLGILRGRYVKLAAISHTEKHAGRMDLVRAIESAMEESIDQDSEIAHPPSPGSVTIQRATAQLAETFGRSAVAVLPLRHAEEPAGAIVIERPIDQPFDYTALELARVVADLCAPRLLELSRSDRWIGARAADAAKRLLSRAVGPRHTWAKAAAVAAAALIAVALFVKGPYQVEAPFVINPARRVTLTAPFESYLFASDVRPGDRVIAGRTVLAELDASELRLLLTEALAERDTLLASAAVAQQEDRLGEHRIGLLQAEQIDARIDLLRWRIDRATVTSPTDGVVVSGDLRKLIGSPVESGRALFEIAPLDELDADLFVGEAAVADLQTGQSGELAPVARPADRIAFTVDRIDPVAEVVERRNIFRVRLRLDERPDWLRPGMEGVGRVDIDRRSYAWLWTHELIDWVRMRLWL